MGCVTAFCNGCNNPKKWAEKSEPCDKCGSVDYDIDDPDWNDKNPSASDDDYDAEDFVADDDEDEECFD